MSHPKVSFIFIHGFCFGPSLWADLIPHFKKFSQHLVNYSLYNPPHQQGFRVDRTLEDLKQIMQTRPEHKWILIGHSLGGYLSLEMIHQNHELISGCILVNSHLHNDTVKRKNIRDKQINLIEKRGLSSYLRVFYQNMDQTNAVKWQKQFGHLLNAQTTLDQLVYMRDRAVYFPSIENFSKQKFLGIIHAKRDNLITNNIVFEKYAQLNMGHVEVIPGGHISPLNQPQACIKALNKMWPHLSFLLAR